MNARPAPIEPHLFIIFGGTGDLARRKLLPALYHLVRQGQLPRSRVLGIGRRGTFDDASYRQWAREGLRQAGLPVDDAESRWCDACLHYQPLGEGRPEDYRALADRIAALEREHELPGNRAVNLALPPGGFPAAISGLAAAEVNRGPGWTRIVVEKPFGRDLESARELNALIATHFEESQVYRIDHYLGKDTVQNLLTFRVANAIFESLWNRDRVRSVQITVAEEIGVEGRGEFYDQVGALRDIVQNHLAQVLAITAMELPAALEAKFVRDEKAKVLRSVQPLRAEDAVFGQYAAAESGAERQPGYREEEGVAVDSSTETFVAARLHVDNWRWQGVPFYIRTGKRLPRRLTTIVVNFRSPALTCFEPFTCEVECNRMVITLQPDEGFDLHFNVKAPGQPFRLVRDRLRFRYREAFGELPEAYEALILDVLRGEQTFFVRADEVELAWRMLDPLLGGPVELHPYPAGSWGPDAAERLIEEGEWYEPSPQS